MITDNLHRIIQMIDAKYTAALPEGITPRQIIVLQELHKNPGVSQNLITEATGIDRSTLADIVRRLEKRDLIDRKRSKGDARAYEVKLTSTGLALLKRSDEALKKIDADLAKDKAVASLIASGRLVVDGLRAA